MAKKAAEIEPKSDDVILLDSDDQPVRGLSRASAGIGDATPYRITDPVTGQTYEHVGQDVKGRATYRPS
jgi:hypothetical protein